MSITTELPTRGQKSGQMIPESHRTGANRTERGWDKKMTSSSSEPGSSAASASSSSSVSRGPTTSTHADVQQSEDRSLLDYNSFDVCVYCRGLRGFQYSSQIVCNAIHSCSCVFTIDAIRAKEHEYCLESGKQALTARGSGVCSSSAGLSLKVFRDPSH